jgi:hypothetical protein
MKTESASTNIGDNVDSPSTNRNDALFNYTAYLYSNLDKLIFSNKELVKALQPAHHTPKTDAFL